MVYGHISGVACITQCSTGALQLMHCSPAHPATEGPLRGTRSSLNTAWVLCVGVCSQQEGAVVLTWQRQQVSQLAQLELELEPRHKLVSSASVALPRE